jgi:hypothetical protein
MVAAGPYRGSSIFRHKFGSLSKGSKSQELGKIGEFRPGSIRHRFSAPQGAFFVESWPL